MRHWADAAPAYWGRWGEPVDGASGVWRFPIKDHDRLIHVLDHLVSLTPTHESWHTMAIYCAQDATGAFPLSAFKACQPLPALHAQLRHPWVMGDLTPYMRTYLQPIVDLVRGGKVFGYEALCRVCTPGGDTLAGGEAFMLARRANREEAFDLACVRSALSSKAHVVGKEFPVFVNVMPNHLLSEDFVDRCGSWIRAYGLSPQEIVVELVESERVNPEALVGICEELRSKGFRIALDDVGSGYNGLTILATLHPDFVKLDRNLVHGVQGSRVRLVLLEALISLSQRLGCATIAEGLERIEDVCVCQDMGIHYAQGYYFAHPSPYLERPLPLPPRKAANRPLVKGMIRLADFVDSTPTLPITATLTDAQELLHRYPELPYVVALDGRSPVGFIDRSILNFRTETCLSNFCRPATRLLNDRVAKAVLARRLFHETNSNRPWVVVDDDNSYLGTIEPWVILSQLIANADSEELHPLSLLPTGPVLRSTLDMQLQARKDVILVYIDIDHFKAFNDRYGFIRGDAMIKLLAEIIRQERTVWPDCYMGHIGGDDFIALLPQEAPDLFTRLTQMVESFHRLSAHLYDVKDVNNGYYVTECGDSYPVAAVSVIVVNGSREPLTDSFKVSERAAQLKKLGKSQCGSVIVLEGDPPAVLPIRFSASDECWRSLIVDTLKDVSRCRRDQSHHDLDDVFKSHPFFELFYELDGRGVQRHPNWVNPLMRGRIKGGGVGMDRSSKPYFEEVRKTREPYLSGIYLSTASEDFCVTVSVPLFDENGTFDGALVADIDLPGFVGLFKKPEARAGEKGAAGNPGRAS
ncbi:MAG: EAL domain-containing protein [Syntrophobacteraceae bacterium]